MSANDRIQGRAGGAGVHPGGVSVGRIGVGALGLLLLPTAVAADPGPVFGIPRLGGLTLDGQVGDWAKAGFRVEALAPTDGLAALAGLSAAFRLAWDEQGLLVLVVVRDATPKEDANLATLWQGDSVELFLADAVGSPRYCQVLIAPGRDPKAGQGVRVKVIDYRPEAERTAGLEVTAAATGDDTGYVLEARVPWAGLGIVADPGVEVGFQLYVNDVDASGSRRTLRWFPLGETHRDPTHMHRVRLSGKPSPPVLVAAAGRYENLVHTRIDVAAAPELAAEPVVVKAGRRVLISGQLGPGPGPTTASLVGPMPARGSGFGPLRVQVGGSEAVDLTLPDVDAARRAEFSNGRLRYTPVFAGDRFPGIDFEAPGWIETLVGPYTVACAFYDAGFERVAAPAKPGRYGAVVTLAAADGLTRTEFLTLFRAPALPGWQQWAAQAWTRVDGGLPKELGIPADVVSTQTETLAGLAHDLLADALGREADAAVVLAGLSEADPKAPPMVQRTSPGTRDRAWWYELKKRLGLVDMKFLVDLPDDYERDATSTWPLVLFLHGAGERGTDLNQVRIHGPPKLAKAGRRFPFILVSPQCRPGEWWLPAELNDLLVETVTQYRVDQDRIYVTGLSMGGFGTWALALEYPDRFAAIAPICSGGDPKDAARLRDLPAWVFHGGRDSVVPPARGEEMVKALQAVGGKPGWTLYPNADHDSWTATYANPALYAWFLANRRGGAPVAPPAAE